MNKTPIHLISIFLVIISFSVIRAQNVPITSDHPVNDFIVRYYTRNVVQSIHISQRPFSLEQIMVALTEISESQLSNREKQLVLSYIKEFSLHEIETGLQAPWQWKSMKNSLHKFFTPYSNISPQNRLLTYEDNSLHLWSNWQEWVTMDTYDGSTRSFFRDRVSFSGQFDSSLSFFSDYTLFRVGFQLGDPTPIEFKQGFMFIEENTNWLVWDASQASVFWKTKMANIEFSKLPIIWGYSKLHSPIFSGNIQPFTFFRISKNYKWIRGSSFIGSLMVNGDGHSQKIEEKHISAHRFEFDVTTSLTLAFNEMVIYARRPIELGYLLPINLFWSEEHSLGNRDNVLMAFDVYWKAKPGLAVYGTFFWDELAWFELFKPWWGNKFVFQSGMHWVPFIEPYLPDFKVEMTISRPWVYTHQDSLLNFTSASHTLGFPIGPNSQLFYIESNMWLSQKMHISINASYILKGSGLGSDANDNYNFRNRDLDDNTPFLLGKISEEFIGGGSFQWKLTELLNLTGQFSLSDKNKYSGRVGIMFLY